MCHIVPGARDTSGEKMDRIPGLLSSIAADTEEIITEISGHREKGRCANE